MDQAHFVRRILRTGLFFSGSLAMQASVIQTLLRNLEMGALVSVHYYAPVYALILIFAVCHSLKTGTARSI